MTPNCATILKHLEMHGPITSIEAATVYKIRQLPARIFDLKALGNTIVTEMKRDAVGQRYARYRLVD
jgi:hypothetical protein